MTNEAGIKNNCPQNALPLSKISVWLHFFAGVELLLFAASHIAFIAEFSSFDSSFAQANPVFVFVTNKTMYFLAAIVETIIGLLCLRFRGHNLVNMLILTFVGVIVWYRWAFYFAGGVRCNCLGLLGKLLHVSKFGEQYLSILALILLVLCTAPSLWCLVRSVAKKFFPSSLPLILLLLMRQQSLGAEMIEVHGELEAARYNPVLGKPFKETQVHVGFVAIIAGNTWEICATNLNDNTWWGWIVYDGTNTYTFSPGGNLWLGERPENNLGFVTISPSAFYNSPEDDTLGLATIYVTYILSPSNIIPDKNGVVQMPLPWLLSRMTPQSYGYKWIIHPPSGKFIESFEVVRDQALDLSDKEEILRWEMDCPDNIGDQNWFKGSLAFRKEIPTGFVEARYGCSNWDYTNGLSIPKESQLTYWLYGANPKHLYRYHHYQANLKATAMILHNSSENFLPKLDLPASVHDYRYKKTNETHVFNYAEYKLKPDEAWKSDHDPVLLAQAEYYLKHGPNISSPHPVTQKNMITWLVFGVLLLFPTVVCVAIFWSGLRKTKKTS